MASCRSFFHTINQFLANNTRNGPDFEQQYMKRNFLSKYYAYLSNNIGAPSPIRVILVHYSYDELEKLFERLVKEYIERVDTGSNGKKAIEMFAKDVVFVVFNVKQEIRCIGDGLTTRITQLYMECQAGGIPSTSMPKIYSPLISSLPHNMLDICLDN